MDREIVVPKVKSLPGPNAKKWIAYHHKYAARSTYVDNFVWDRSKPAIGPFCMDPDGNTFLDFVSHVGASALGYNHPRLLEVQKTLAKVDPDRYAGADFVCSWGEHPDHPELPTPSHLHHKVIEWTKQFGFDCAFFSNTGAEAIENAIKVAYSYRRNNGYGVCFDGAFHGRSLGALSLNRSKMVHRKWYPELPKIVSVPYVGESRGYESQLYVVARNGQKVSRLQNLLDPSFGIVHHEEVAYVIMEPVQGEGGYVFPHKEFTKEVQEVCERYHIPLIMDEIQSGLGRTGKRWACEHFKMKPDIITASKGLRVGATIGKREMFPDEDGRISGTWVEGNAIASALGYTILDTIDKENLLSNAEKQGAYFRKRLQELPNEVFSGVRGLGLMDAVDVPSKDFRTKLLQECLRQGLLLVGCGYKSIRFLPPLDVTKREIDICVDILGNAAKKVR